MRGRWRSPSRPWSAASAAACRSLKPGDRFLAEAIGRMIVDHANGLHEGVADRRADELESEALQILAHGVRFRRARGNLVGSRPTVHERLAADKLPNVAGELAELFLYRQKSASIGYGAFHLTPVANDARIG